MSEQMIYGIHAVNALLKNPNRKIKHIFVNQDRQDPRMRKLLDVIPKNISLTHLSPAKMAVQFPNETHQGIVAIADPLPHYHEKELPLLLDGKVNPVVLILDGVTDPHNFGACLRSADAAGVDIVMIPKDKSAPMTPVVSKVACGAAESLPIIRVTNLVRTLGVLKDLGFWIYGAAGEAEQTLYELDARRSLALVMGSEGDGLRRLTKEHCDGLFSIPMLGSVSSLNVSVATGVCLFEVVRQRRKTLL